MSGAAVTKRPVSIDAQLMHDPSSQSEVLLGDAGSLQQSEKICGNADASAHVLATGIQPISKSAKTLARRNDMNLISTIAALAGKFTVHGLLGKSSSFASNIAGSTAAVIIKICFRR